MIVILSQLARNTLLISYCRLFLRRYIFASEKTHENGKRRIEKTSLFYLAIRRCAKYCDENVCISMHPLASHKPHVQTSRNFLYLLSVAWFSSDDNAIGVCCVLPVDDVMFSRSGPGGAWHWQYRRGRRAAASSQNLPCIRRGGGRMHAACLTLLSYTMATNCAPGRSLMSTIALDYAVYRLDSIFWLASTLSVPWSDTITELVEVLTARVLSTSTSIHVEDARHCTSTVRLRHAETSDQSNLTLLRGQCVWKTIIRLGLGKKGWYNIITK